MTTMNIPDFAGISTAVEKPNSNGRVAAANSRPVVLSTEDLATLTALIALFPTSIGTKTAANSLAVTLASDGPFITSTGNPGDAAWTTGSGTIIALLKAIAASAISTAPTPVQERNQSYETIIASQTDQIMGTTGAVGDYLSHLIITPSTTSPGNVIIKDGGNIIFTFNGGASSVTTLIPFMVPLGLSSLNTGWKITTGANVAAVAVGNFT